MSRFLHDVPQSASTLRSPQVLEGISRGCWIVSPAWIKDSAAAGRWLAEADYELAEAFPGAKVRLR